MHKKRVEETQNKRNKSFFPSSSLILFVSTFFCFDGCSCLKVSIKFDAHFYLLLLTKCFIFSLLPFQCDNLKCDKTKWKSSLK